MKIIGFVKSLLPRIDKNAVLEDIEITKTELTTGVIPAYDSARSFFKAAGFKSDQTKSLQSVFYRNYSVKSNKKQENMVAEIYESLKTVKENLEYIEDQVEDLFNRDILKDGLTVRKAILLRAVDHITFISRFAIDLLNVIYVYEAHERNADLQEGFAGSKRLLEMVQKNVFVFAKLLTNYSQKPEDFKLMIQKLPETVLNDQTVNHVVAIYKENDLDPLAHTLINEFQGNPIYHIRLMIAEWQADRYKAFKDKKKMLELRLLHLKMQQEDKSDAALNREIEYIQDRVEKIDFKLKKMES